MKIPLFLPFLVILVISSCTPKTVEKTVDPGVPDKYVTENPEELAEGCTTFSTSSYPEDALNEHVIYRGFLRENDLVTAFPHWKRAFELAPAADGKRSIQYTDGAKFYKYFFQQTTDSLERVGYIAKIRELYDAAVRCYPKDYFLKGLLAFDLYYSFRDYTTDEEIYTLFKETIDKDGLKTPAFVLNPFTDLLISRFNNGEITMSEAQTYTGLIRKILAHGLKESKEQENFAIVESYAPSRLEEFEAVEDFYPSTYYLQNYYPQYQADSLNCDVVESVYSKLRWGKISPEEPRMLRMNEFIQKNCQVADQSSFGRQAFDALQSGRFREAVGLFEKASNEASAPTKKAQYQLIIAKIYYTHLKDFRKSRQFALQSAKFDPNSGAPYILIGKLYASSGPLCGPGRGWDSQIVTWPAIDKWQIARNLDPSVAAEANRLINQYTKYMPNIEDIFQRNIKEGAPFFVGCWIQESTTVRAAK